LNLLPILRFETVHKKETMHTELVYQTDSYKKNLVTTVTEVNHEKSSLLLHGTILFPGGGGQPADRGWLIRNNDSCNISGILKEGDKVWYKLDGILPSEGEVVELMIDWERRYQLMRTHTAMHILCGVIWRDYKAQVTGGNMEPLNGRMDFEFEKMGRELVNEIEEKINLEVQNAREIEVTILPRIEANRIPDLIRTKINLLPPSLTEIRTVEIRGLDLQADGGTHVRNTSEVGQILITEYKSKGRINKRLKIRLEESK
jgi:misacylated tRNA(Ala) deacylase